MRASQPKHFLMAHRPPLSDAEDLALRTLWREQGFVDSASAHFARRSRAYQWRINAALLIALCLVSMCWLAPDWLLPRLSAKEAAQGWLADYLFWRAVVSSICLCVGLICWWRQRNLLHFWIGFTLFTSVMWVLDRWLIGAAHAQGQDFMVPLLWPLRVLLLVIGVVNIWRHAFAPLPAQRRLLNWRLKRQA